MCYAGNLGMVDLVVSFFVDISDGVDSSSFLSSCRGRTEIHGTCCELDTFVVVDIRRMGMVVAFAGRLENKRKIVWFNIKVLRWIFKSQKHLASRQLFLFST